MNGAKMAMKTTAATITKPAIAPGLRRSRTHASPHRPPLADSNDASRTSTAPTLTSRA